ncbi:biotin carboxylase N-terminal domain-containing protein [Phyllobacterium sp. SB3]|uniref:acetyl-CoA carboxylase biotin carboxylase subunit n=1 Tax=Phyllobacterium sp. SB3 TaxID=3156073 RepID=UPI0032AE89E3
MQKVLIANRSEIACRIIRACKDQGLDTVAIFAPVDEGALYVAMADEGICIPAAKPVQSYLDIAAIIAAAKEKGADAIHPGYGFLAENEDFAEAVEAAGLIFIGPRPETIRIMGDKERARSLAKAAGVPILEGSPRFPEGALDDLENAAAAVGYPLLVKSCAGGGGIGMRIVQEEGQLRSTAQSTQAQAARSFGDGTIFLERYVQNARHVEVQVFGFGDGEAVHFFERECSIQRRFQKIVEESPSPGINEAVRQKMTSSALALAKSVNYRGAGTLEFIVDGSSGDFFFLEMNTRIQVEHPVTEMVTNQDLVALQLRLAAGELSSNDLRQADIHLDGHAIEVRLCAENPERMFLPSPGALQHLVFPTASDDVRIETGLRQGDTVTPHFDSMIAKIICHGATREEATATMKTALADTDLGTFTCNLRLLRTIISHDAFARRQTFTNFLTLQKESLGL